jgi:hypothetical protein
VDAEGKWLFAGREMAAFTDEEEQLFGTAEGAVAARQPAA